LATYFATVVWPTLIPSLEQFAVNPGRSPLILLAGATGLEPATSGVTGLLLIEIAKEFQ